MKALRFTFILLLCLGVFLCLGAAAYAEPAVINSGTCGADGDNLTWTLYDTGELVIDGTGAMADYNPWYTNRLKISSVTICDGVTSIGGWAFYNCKSLTSVTIPEGVTSIGSCTFSGCSSLTSVTIPDSVTSIGEGAFRNCSSLTSVTLPACVTSMNDIGLTDSKLLKSAGPIGSGCDIEFGWTSKIPDDAFSSCDQLTSIIIPDSVTSVGDWAFCKCSGLTRITLPACVTSMYDIGLTDSKFLKSAGPIGSGCDIEFGWTSKIPDGAFSGCKQLTNIIIPDSITSIGSFAFSGCSELTHITLPACVTSLYDAGLYSCKYLKSAGPIGSDCNIEFGWTHDIPEYAFSFSTYLSSVTIPQGVVSIGHEAFKNCTSLADATIPPSVISIGSGAFTACSSLKHITIPANVKNSRYIGINNSEFLESAGPIGSGCDIEFGWTDEIPGGAFSGCRSLTSVTIPESVTSIDEYAFYDCGNLTDVYYGSSEEQWKTINIGSGNEPLKTATIHYHSVRPNPDFILPASLNTVESEAFTGGAFTYVLIPETVAHIDGGAFASCPKLAYAQFAGADTAIDPAAFDGVTGLTIIAPGGSTAETFAAAHGFDFVPAA